MCIRDSSHPAAQPGIASWQLVGERTFDKLKDARVIPRTEDGRAARVDVDTAALYSHGFRWLLVDNSVEERLLDRIAARFPEAIAECDDYTLRAVPTGRTPARSPPGSAPPP